MKSSPTTPAAPAAPPSEEAAVRFDLARFLPYNLVCLASAMSSEWAEVYGARHGLTTAEWRVLAHLSQEPAVSVREIHRRVDMDKPRITRAAQRLAAAGLIDRAGSQTDRRLVSLSLTEAGRALMAELIPLALEAEREAVSVLSPDEAQTFERLIGKLLAARRDG